MLKNKTKQKGKEFQRNISVETTSKANCIANKKFEITLKIYIQPKKKVVKITKARYIYLISKRNFYKNWRFDFLLNNNDMKKQENDDQKNFVQLFECK